MNQNITLALLTTAFVTSITGAGCHFEGDVNFTDPSTVPDPNCGSYEEVMVKLPVEDADCETDGPIVTEVRTIGIGDNGDALQITTNSPDGDSPQIQYLAFESHDSAKRTYPFRCDVSHHSSEETVWECTPSKGNVYRNEEEVTEDDYQEIGLREFVVQGQSGTCTSPIHYVKTSIWVACSEKTPDLSRLKINGSAFPNLFYTNP